MCLKMLAKYSCILFLTFLLSSCGGDDHLKDLQDYLNKLKKVDNKSTEKKGIDLSDVPVSVFYQSKNLRSPFDSMETNRQPTAHTHPIQSYPIAMLRLVGILAVNNMLEAIIVAPDERVYQVKKGDIIGLQRGKIINITADRVEVSAVEQDAAEGVRERIVTLQLKEEK